MKKTALLLLLTWILALQGCSGGTAAEKSDESTRFGETAVRAESAKTGESANSGSSNNQSGIDGVESEKSVENAESEKSVENTESGKGTENAESAKSSGVSGSMGIGMGKDQAGIDKDAEKPILTIGEVGEDSAAGLAGGLLSAGGKEQEKSETESQVTGEKAGVPSAKEKAKTAKSTESESGETADSQRAESAGTAEKAKAKTAKGTESESGETADSQKAESAGTAEKAKAKTAKGTESESGETADSQKAESAGTAEADSLKKNSTIKKRKKKAKDVEIRIGFAGDLNLSEGWETTVFMDKQTNGILDCFSPELLREMRDFDVFMLNNEYTYSLRGEPKGKTYTFRAYPDRVANLDTLGVDIVLVANNHIMDYGEKSLLDTLDTLDRAGIVHVGAGRNIKEAARPAIYDANGHSIAFVAASCAEEHENTIWTTPATEDTPGILGCYDPSMFCKAVSDAAQMADYVIASVHWGYEYLDKYSAEQEEMARQLVAAGADAVIGTHPHILQGVKFMDGAPIFYSLGNFWFNGEDLMTGMAELTLRLPADPKEKPELVRTRFIPCTQRGLYTSEAADAQESEQILQHLRDISFGTVIESDGTVLPDQ